MLKSDVQQAGVQEAAGDQPPVLVALARSRARRARGRRRPRRLDERVAAADRPVASEAAITLIAISA